jgi:DNA primase
MNLNRSYTLDAETIARGLQKPKRAGPGKYVACCPAHDDKSPSLSIKDAPGKVLVHCHAGCSQDEVINALRDLGLWHTASEYQIDRRKHSELKETIRHHQQILWFGVDLVKQGQTLSNIDRSQLKISIEFLKRYSHG